MISQTTLVHSMNRSRCNLAKKKKKKRKEMTIELQKNWSRSVLWEDIFTNLQRSKAVESCYGSRDLYMSFTQILKIITANILVTVECHLWAFNIEQRSRNSLDFQIIISKYIYIYLTIYFLTI